MSPGVAVALLTGLAAALRFATLGEQGLWSDEMLTLTSANGSLRDSLAAVKNFEGNPPGYSVLAWLWVRVFGDSDVGIRSLSAAAGTLAVPVAYGVGRELASRRAGIIFAALVAANPFLIWYSQEARSYGPLILFVAASLLFFARARTEPRARELAGWAAASILAIGTHYYAGVVVAIQAGWLLASVPRERRRATAIAAAVPAAVSAALLPLALSQSDRAGWVATLDLGRRLAQVPEQFAVGNSHPIVAPSLAVGLVTVVAAIAVVRSRDTRSRSGAAAMFGIAGMALALALAGVVVGRDFVLARNLLPVWLPLAAGVAIGLASLRPRWLGALASVALCGIWLGLFAEVQADRRLQRGAWHEAASLVGERPGERVIFATGSYHSSPLSRYLPRAERLPDGAIRFATEVVLLTHEKPERGRLCWWGAACGIPGSSSSPSAPDEFRLVETAERDGFTMMRYRSPHPIAVAAPEPGMWAYLQRD